MLPPSLSPRKSALKAPGIAFDYYYEVANDDESNLTNKQIELIRLIKNEGRILKRNVSKAKYVMNLLDKGHIVEVKEEKRRLKIPNYKYEALQRW